MIGASAGKAGVNDWLADPPFHVVFHPELLRGKQTPYKWQKQEFWELRITNCTRSCHILLVKTSLGTTPDGIRYSISI
jgi:hypothetical protein